MAQETFTISFDINDDIERQFRSIAEKLLNHSVIIVDDNQFRIIELEFYLFHPEHHPDPFVHCHEKQKTTMQWYFHESGLGLDLTFGTNEFYGGILIRGIQDILSKRSFSGPWNSLHAMLSSMSVANCLSSKRFIISEYSNMEPRDLKRDIRKNLRLPELMKGDLYSTICNNITEDEKKSIKEFYEDYGNLELKRKQGISKNKNDALKQNDALIQVVSHLRRFYNKKYCYSIFVNNN